MKQTEKNIMANGIWKYNAFITSRDKMHNKHMHNNIYLAHHINFINTVFSNV